LPRPALRASVAARDNAGQWRTDKSVRSGAARAWRRAARRSRNATGPPMLGLVTVLLANVGKKLGVKLTVST
jgi:hypothetical protein